jgi:hypothetical protein
VASTQVMCASEIILNLLCEPVVKVSDSGVLHSLLLGSIHDLSVSETTQHFETESVSTLRWIGEESQNRTESDMCLSDDRKSQFTKCVLFIMLRLWTMEGENVGNLIDYEVGTSSAYVCY